MKNIRLLVLLSQFAISVISPLLVFILGARWLTLRFDLGRWVIAVGVLLGVAGAISGLVNSLRQLKREADKETKDVPVSFNNHE